MAMNRLVRSGKWIGLLLLSALFCGAAENDWTHGWQQRWYRQAVETSPLAAQDGHLALPVQWPGDNEFVRPVANGWDAFGSVKFSVQTPADLPPHADIYLFVKDWDNLWFQVRLGPVQPDQSYEFNVPLHGTEAVRLWQPRFHFRPWHQRMPAQVRECGVKLHYTNDNAPSDFKNTLKLTGFSLEPRVKEEPTGATVKVLPRTPMAPVVGDCIEMTFETTLPFLDPFNRKEVDLTAAVLRPDGETDTVRLFYYEDFLFDWQDGHGPLTPSAAPQFRMRYTPVEPGTYRITIGGKIGSATVALPEHVAEVKDSAFQGFIQPATFDNRLLMHSRDRTEFFGTALNTRSPFDTRYMDSFPFTAWPDRGISIYREMFRKYQQCGIKIVELWMSPWFLGLEGIPDSPGGHGIGYMNQYRAWQLDLLMQWAKEFDLRVVILLNNHGKFSSWCDADWDTNPFNVTQGGFLETPMEYFTDERAMAAFEKFADYAVARWGFSPNLFAWKLFSEIDLTGNNRSWYKTTPVIAWHKRMATYMKDQDPNRHMITTHWAESYKLVNKSLALLPEIDILTLDGYYRGTGAELAIDIITGTIEFSKGMGKPCVITEYGGNPWADGVAHMMNQHHLITWIGFFGMLPNAPGYWWYPQVEEKNMYPAYAAFDRFVKGETRAGGVTRWDRDYDKNITLWEVRKEDALYLWLYDEPSFYQRAQNEPMRRREGIKVDVGGLPAGNWRIELWDPQAGEILSTRQIELKDAPYSLELPPFRGDIAIKVKQAAAPTVGQIQ